METVYEVDRDKKVIRMYGSRIGSFGFEYPLRDYLPEGFVRVDLVESEGGRAVVRRAGQQ